MRCKYCNVEIGCKAKLCPLCHEKLEPSEDIKSLPQAYPSKRQTTKKPRRLFSATSLYLSIALTVFIICIPINLLTTPDIYWFGIVGIACLYGLILVRNTILSNNSIGIKIFWQLVAIFCVLLVVNNLLQSQLPTLNSNWIWDYGLPSILTISSLTIGIYTAIAFSKWHEVIVDAISVSAIGFLPLILYAFGVVEVQYMSIACACISAVVIIFCAVLGRRTLFIEIKKRFHV